MAVVSPDLPPRIRNTRRSADWKTVTAPVPASSPLPMWSLTMARNSSIETPRVSAASVSEYCTFGAFKGVMVDRLIGYTVCNKCRLANASTQSGGVLSSWEGSPDGPQALRY